MIRLAVSAAFLSAIAGTAIAQNSQPISTSLAECSAIFGEVARMGANRGRDRAETARLDMSADLFFDNAIIQAGAEGFEDPDSRVEQTYTAMVEKWSGQFSSLWNLRKNLDWINYCRALGEDCGFLPLN